MLGYWTKPENILFKNDEVCPVPAAAAARRRRLLLLYLSLNNTFLLFHKAVCRNDKIFIEIRNFDLF